MSLEVATEVVLSSGIFGTVRALSEGRVDLEWLRAPYHGGPPGRRRRVEEVAAPAPDNAGGHRPGNEDPGPARTRQRTEGDPSPWRRDPRPVRTLTIFGLASSPDLWAGRARQTWKPRLGLDLEGGTRITLSAIDRAARSPRPSSTRQRIVDARVNGSGVSEAEVSTQGDRNIIVEIPGQNAQRPRRRGEAHGPAALPTGGRQPQPGAAVAARRPPPAPRAHPPDRRRLRRQPPQGRQPIADGDAEGPGSG